MRNRTLATGAFVATLVGTLGLLAGGCERRTKTDEAVEEIQDEIDDAKEEIEDEIDDAD